MKSWYYNINFFYNFIDRAERHDFWSRFLLFILLSFFPLFLGGKRKGENNKQSHGQKSCLSARSFYIAPNLCRILVRQYNYDHDDNTVYWVFIIGMDNNRPTLLYDLYHCWGFGARDPCPLEGSGAGKKMYKELEPEPEPKPEGAGDKSREPVKKCTGS